MANRIFVKRNNVTGIVPAAAVDIVAGELAVNTKDGKLFSTDGSTVFEVGANVTSLNVTSNSFVVGTTLAVVANGNVGINKNSPAYTLDVAGTIRASSNVYSNTGVIVDNGSGNTVVSNSSVLTIGTATVNVSINATSFSGTANNATNLGGTAAASYQLTGSTLSANIAAYLPTYTGVVNGSSLTVGTSFVANATNINLGTIGVANGLVITTSTINIGNSSVNTTINATSFSGTALTANNASYLGTVAAASYVNTSGAYTITGMHTYNNGITFANTVTANASNGTSGQVLTSSGSTGNVYWSTTGATLNANNTDTQTFYPAMSNNITGSWSNAVISTSKFYFVPSTGTLSATIFTSLSDQTAKTNIQIITNATETVKQIDGVSFNWKDNNKKSYGVIAQNIEKILPDLVEENSGVKSVNYLGIIGFLIEAVKELDARLNVLESK